MEKKKQGKKSPEIVRKIINNNRGRPDNDGFSGSDGNELNDDDDVDVSMYTN